MFFAGAVLFQLVTLPVEFNASSRAMAILSQGYLANDEVRSARRVLNAAAMTYVAAAATAVLQLVGLCSCAAQTNNSRRGKRFEAPRPCGQGPFVYGLATAFRYIMSL